MIFYSNNQYCSTHNLLFTYIVLPPGRNPTGRFFATNPWVFSLLRLSLFESALSFPAVYSMPFPTACNIALFISLYNGLSAQFFCCANPPCLSNRRTISLLLWGTSSISFPLLSKFSYWGDSLQRQTKNMSDQLKSPPWSWRKQIMWSSVHSIPVSSLSSRMATVAISLIGGRDIHTWNINEHWIQNNACHKLPSPGSVRPVGIFHFWDDK